MKPLFSGHIVEEELRGIGRPPAHLLELGPREAFAPAFDQQQRHAARARPAGAHRHGVVVGTHARGDEHLGAVDHVMVALAPCGGLEVGDVGAAARLGDGERADLLARQDLGQQLALHPFRPQRRDRRRADRVAVQAGIQSAAAVPCHLAGLDDAEERIGRNAAILLGKAELHQPGRGCFPVQFSREFLGLVPLVDERHDLAIDKAAYGLPERLMLGRVERAGSA
jgi:hypothetical protein